jgi:hypothetical protein
MIDEMTINGADPTTDLFTSASLSGWAVQSRDGWSYASVTARDLFSSSLKAELTRRLAAVSRAISEALQKLRSPASPRSPASRSPMETPSLSVRR